MAKRKAFHRCDLPFTMHDDHFSLLLSAAAGDRLIAGESREHRGRTADDAERMRSSGNSASIVTDAGAR